MPKKPTEPKTEIETVTTPVRNSSAYTRVVANTRLEVINAKQNPTDVTQKVTKKWAVIAFNGNKKRMIGQSDKKYPAIDILLATEKLLKAAEAKKSDKSE